MSSGITIHWYNVNSGRVNKPCPQCGSSNVHMSVTPTGERFKRKQLWDANGQCENGHMIIRFHNVLFDHAPGHSRYATAAPLD